ncbi:MAG: lamin tail domain-containing protein [PVC group bacterium]
MKRNTLFIAAAAAIILSGFLTASAFAGGTLEVWFIWANGSSGTGTLIRGPNGTTVLYDEMGGYSAAWYLYDLLSELGITHIDYAVAGHYDSDHCGGLDDLSWFLGGYSHFGTFYDRGGTAKYDGDIPSDYYETVNEFPAMRAVPTLGPAGAIDLGDGATLTFLSRGAPDYTGGTNGRIYVYNQPDLTSGISENEKSITALLTYGGFDLYLGSDAEGDTESAIADVIVDDLGRDPDVCLVDHHGSDTYGISSEAFCAKMDPEVAVIPVWSNGYGHPRGTTVEHFQAAVEPLDQRIIRLHPGDEGDPNWAPETMAYCHTSNRHVYLYTNGVTYTVDTVERVGGNDITEPGLTNHYADEGYQLLITEAAVDQNQPLGHDWIELSMKLGSADLSAIYMTDLDEVYPVADNGPLTMVTGDLLVIHDSAGTSENNSTGKSANGLWDVYQASLSLAADDDQFIITTENSADPGGGSILDALCWSNDDGSMVSGEAADGNNLISKNHWGDPEAGDGLFTASDQGPAAGDINIGYAQRLTFTDHNSAPDWVISATNDYGDPPPTATPTPTPSPTPSVTPSATPTPSVTPTPSPTVTPTPPPSPTLTPAPPEGDVVINEIHADPAYGLAGDANGDGYREGWEDEFVELVNWTDHTVDLGGCTLSDDTAVRYTFDNPFEVPPGKAVVVFGGGTPAGDFGGSAWVTVSDVCCGLYLTNSGDTVTLRDGAFIYDSVTYGMNGGLDQSLNRYPEKRGFFYLHSEIPGSGGSLYSPGTKVNGDIFVYEPTPTATPTVTPSPVPTATPSPSPSVTVTPVPSPTPTRTVTPSPTPVPTASPAPTNTPSPSATPAPTASPSPSRTPTPSPSPTGTATASPTPSPTPGASPTCGPPAPLDHRAGAAGDFDGDGTDDIAVFRETSGLWAVRGITRMYFGAASDVPAAGDYTGSGTTEIGIFRGGSGLWAVRKVTRLYFGHGADTPVPGDYDGDGVCDPGIFRPAAGLWAVRGITRVYFGKAGDEPVPGDYNGTGTGGIAVFRGSSGLWAIQGVSRLYFGRGGDWPVPGDYSGDGTWRAAVFRAEAGLWAIRGTTRNYFGNCSDRPVPADYNGDLTDDRSIFRPPAGLWAVRGVTRAYFGGDGDTPVTR